ncbi:MAG: RNA methyltransferase [Mobilicoccus sp.]|nr:RNA methyltransferase [Mobilicoccus sp.]
MTQARDPLTNPRAARVRKVAALARRAVRAREGLFLVEGPQGVEEAVRHRPDLVRDVYVDPAASDRVADIAHAARSASLYVHEASPEVLATMGDAETSQGILAVCTMLDVPLVDVLAARPRTLAVLAHVRDPGNAGTVLRCADAAGADAVVLTSASVDVYNPKVVRSTAGSLFHVPVVVGVPVEDVLAACRAADLATIAADGAGDTLLGDADLQRAHAWVFGNEAWGLPAELRAACDDVVRVPIHGRAESLNLAMAATVCLYESARSRPRGGSASGRDPDTVPM